MAGKAKSNLGGTSHQTMHQPERELCLRSSVNPSRAVTNLNWPSTMQTRKDPPHAVLSTAWPTQECWAGCESLMLLGSLQVGCLPCSQ